jgi:hypothetical protein
LFFLEVIRRLSVAHKGLDSFQATTARPTGKQGFDARSFFETPTNTLQGDLPETPTNTFARRHIGVKQNKNDLRLVRPSNKTPINQKKVERA